VASVWKIYALLDPRTGEPRYVGQTKQSLIARVQKHISKKEYNHKYSWIAHLRKLGLSPGFIKLYECFDSQTADEAEIFFIDNFKGRGFKLTNMTEGGGAFKHSVETRAKISEGNRGKKRTPEQRARISETRKGKPLTLAHRANLVKSAKSRKLTAEARARIAAGSLGKKRSADTIAKRVAAYKKTCAARKARVELGAAECP